MPQAFEEAPLSCVAQVQKYAPATGAEANPVIAEILLTRGEMERGGRDWRSASKFLGRCFYPPASVPDFEQPLTLGQQMLLHGLGWENHEIEYVPIPSGYIEWGTAILDRHSLNLKGGGGTVIASMEPFSVL
jgi:hypothetical protein